MEKKEQKVIDLTKVQVPEIDGQVSTVDMSKEISSKLYPQAQTLGVVTGCLDLFKTGYCEYSDEMRDAICSLLEHLGTGYVVKTAIMQAIG